MRIIIMTMIDWKHFPMFVLPGSGSAELPGHIYMCDDTSWSWTQARCHWATAIHIVCICLSILGFYMGVYSELCIILDCQNQVMKISMKITIHHSLLSLNFVKQLLEYIFQIKINMFLKSIFSPKSFCLQVNLKS